MAQTLRAQSQPTLEDLVAGLIDDVARLKSKTASAAGTWILEERGDEMWAISYEQGREVQLT